MIATRYDRRIFLISPSVTGCMIPMVSSAFNSGWIASPEVKMGPTQRITGYGFLVRCHDRGHREEEG